MHVHVCSLLWDCSSHQILVINFVREHRLHIVVPKCPLSTSLNKDSLPYITRTCISGEQAC